MRRSLLRALWPVSLLCRPHVASSVGFLGWGESLFLVRRRDARTLRRLGVDRRQLAHELEKLLEGRAKGEPVPGTYWVRVGQFQVAIPMMALGSQFCPWPHVAEERFSHGGSFDWRIRNPRTGRELQGPGLIVHLIREHGFFEGRKSPYRVDPQALAELLELV